MTTEGRPPRMEALCGLGVGCNTCPGAGGRDGCKRDSGDTLEALVWAVLELADAIRETGRQPTAVHQPAPTMHPTTEGSRP